MKVDDVRGDLEKIGKKPIKRVSQELLGKEEQTEPRIICATVPRGGIRRRTPF